MKYDEMWNGLILLLMWTGGGRAFINLGLNIRFL